MSQVPNLMEALRAAHNAGNEEDAMRFANMINEQNQEVPKPPEKGLKGRKERRRGPQTQTPEEVGSISDILTGSTRIEQIPELGTLPEFGTTEEGDTFKIALGLLSTFKPDAQQEMIQEAIPEAKFETTEDGSIIIEVPTESGEIKRSVLNRPGFSPQDAMTALAQLAAHLGPGRWVKFGKSLLQKAGIGAATSGATEQGLQEIGMELGRKERDPVDVALTAVTAPIGEAASSAYKTIKAMRGAPSETASEILETGIELDVPVLTTDVLPPTTWLGKWAQQMSEKVGPLGSGPKRESQQVARQNVVEELAQEFNVALKTPFAEDIIKSLKTNNAKQLVAAHTQRNAAVKTLDKFGTVETSNTIVEIDKQLAKQAALRDKANTSLVDNLKKIKTSVQGGDFSHVKNIRTEVINDVKAIARGEDKRALDATEAVKSAIDKDLNTFGRKHDRSAAKEWLVSNRKFADELTKTKQTELKRILAGGDATPEKVLNIIHGGKRSELERLNKSLTPKGKSSVRAAIVQDALEKSGFFSGKEINPDKLATDFGKISKRQAIDVFFHGNDKKQLDGLFKLLNATRRAQQAATAHPTGAQALPFFASGGVLGSFYAAPMSTLFVVGTLSAFAKSYESKPIRNLLLKIANAKPGSKIEKELLEEAVAAVIVAQKAAIEQQEQKQEAE